MNICFPLSALASVCLFAAMASSQTPPCMAENDQSPNSNGLVSLSNGQVRYSAVMITPTATNVVQGGRIWTSNNYGTQQGQYMTLELWDEDPANPGVPSTRLGGGTWEGVPSVSTNVFTWQGCSFDTPVVLVSGQNYWMVWAEPGWCGLSANFGGVTLPIIYRSGASGSWSSPTSMAFTYRLYCSLIDAQGVVPFGPSCPSSSNRSPAVFTNQAATVGNTGFNIEGTGLPAGMPAINVFGVTPGFPTLPLPGTNACWASTDMALTIGAVAGTGDIRSPTAAGHVSFSVPIPANTSLQGFYFASQIMALDPGATGALPIVTSNALQITIY